MCEVNRLYLQSLKDLIFWPVRGGVRSGSCGSWLTSCPGSESVELGREAEPRCGPPRPADRGVFGRGWGPLETTLRWYRTAELKTAELETVNGRLFTVGLETGDWCGRQTVEPRTGVFCVSTVLRNIHRVAFLGIVNDHFSVNQTFRTENFFVETVVLSTTVATGRFLLAWFFQIARKSRKMYNKRWSVLWIKQFLSLFRS